MADLPQASVSVDAQAGAVATGVDTLVVIAPVASSADAVPRQYSNFKNIMTKHGYAPGVDFAAIHFDEAKKPVIFIGVPIGTAGVVGQLDSSGVTGTSNVTAAVGGSGAMEEMDIVATVTAGGTVGTDQIKFDLSLDGGLTSKSVRLGTATSYAIPNMGLTLSFGAGTLVVDDVFSCITTAPKWNADGISDARDALAAQQKQSRSWLIVGDMTAAQDATDILTEANGYETANDRFIFVRAQARDMRRAPKMSRLRKKAQLSGQTLTFAEVGATGDTITRSAGSWITDGFVVGDVITVAGSVSNNVTGPIASISATVITFGTTDLAAEAGVSGCSVTGSQGITFAEVGATGDTITRVSGSWIADGFKVGDAISITGSASNNLVSAAIATLSATVITLGADDLVAEVIGAHSITVTAPAELKADALAANEATYASIDAQQRIDISHGRGRKKSLICGASLRRPAAWAACTREYQHDVQVPCWRKADGPLSGWSLEDADGQLVEHDERVDGGALAARFTCLRTYSNGPQGAYVALSLTRDSDGSNLSRTHNMAVTNVACQVVQSSTENAIGDVLVLNEADDNDEATAEEASLVEVEERVNTALAIALLQSKLEGPRASSARWTASRDDILNVPGAELTGELALLLNGTLEKIRTRVRVITPGG